MTHLFRAKSVVVLLDGGRIIELKHFGWWDQSEVVGEGEQVSKIRISIKGTIEDFRSRKVRTEQLRFPSDLFSEESVEWKDTDA